MSLTSAGYEVQYRQLSGAKSDKRPTRGRRSSDDWVVANSTLTPDTSFKVNNLPEGAEFEFRVAAVNDAGPGTPSKSTGPHVVCDPVCE